MPTKLHSITATDLVRNLSRMIDQVRVSGQPLLIKKGTQTVAELRPPRKVGFPLDQLYELLASLPKLGGEKKVLARDLAKVRRKAALPKTPWA